MTTTTIIIINFLEHCHVITTFFLLSSFSMFRNTVAQAAAPVVPAAPRTLNDNANPSLAILLVMLIFAFFITGFCSIYIRHCSEHYVVSGTAIGPRGIDPEVLSTFPIMVYSTVKHLKTGHSVALQCAVCLNEFKDLDALKLLPKCSHVFHPDCIDAWLASHVTCPVCRAKLKPEKAEFKVEIGEGNGESQVFDEMSERRGEVFCEGNEDGVRGGVDGVVGKGHGSSKVGAFGVLARSHSTGHSLVEPGKSLERFTLRLPEEVRTQILDGNRNKCDGKMKRSASYDVVWQSGEGCSGGGEGGGSSSKGKNNNRWVLSMTPPFVSRGWGSSSSSSSGVAPNECTTCSGIPRFWASSISIAREEKECDGRAGLQVV